MAWTQPKTDWKINDRFNVEDWDRIRYNIDEIHYLVKNLFKPVEVEAMVGKTILSFMYARDLNAIESNLDALNAASINLAIGEKMTFVDNGPGITYIELNRIEKACNDLYWQIQQFINRYYFCDDEIYTDEAVGII